MFDGPQAVISAFGHTARSRPLPNAWPLPIAATMALAMIGPTPGTVVARRHNSESLAISWISVETESISLSSPCQRSPQPLQELAHPDGQAVLCIFQNTRQATCEQCTADRDHDAVLEKQGSQLVHDSGASTMKRCRTRCIACISNWSVDLSGTVRMVPRLAASATASASLKSFLFDFR